MVRQSVRKVCSFGSIIALYMGTISTILSVGKMTFFVMIFTFALCFGGYFIRRLFGLNWKLSNLISAGTGICGGSAVAAIGLSTSITEAWHLCFTALPSTPWSS